MAVSFYILGRIHQAEPAVERGRGEVLSLASAPSRSAFPLYGMSLMVVLRRGRPNLRVMASVFAQDRTHDPRLVLAVILVAAGVGFKIAAVPFHMWAPDVYEGRRRRSPRSRSGWIEGRVVRDAHPHLPRRAAVR